MKALNFLPMVLWVLGWALLALLTDLHLKLDKEKSDKLATHLASVTAYGGLLLFIIGLICCFI